MGLPHRSIIDLPEVDNPTRFTRFLAHDVHSTAPCRGCIGGNPLNDTQIDVSFKLLTHVINPVGWNS